MKEQWSHPFIKPVFITDNLLEDKLDIFANEIHRLFEQQGSGRNPVLNVDSLHQTGSNLHKNIVFYPIVKAIHEQLKKFLDAFGYVEYEKYFIGDMWANISREHDGIWPHNHPGSIVSGAFYVRAPEDCKIYFVDKKTFIPMDLPSPYSTSFAEYDCLPGRLLLFRGDFDHGTPPQVSDDEKIVISFNIVKEVNKSQKK